MSPYSDLGHLPPIVRAPSGGPKAAGGVANGSFEVNDGNTELTDWGTWSRGDGAWFAQSGSESPIPFFTVPPPPDGDWAAMTDQFGPGSPILAGVGPVGRLDEPIRRLSQSGGSHGPGQFPATPAG